jgi:hypothetical protein
MSLVYEFDESQFMRSIAVRPFYSTFVYGTISNLLSISLGLFIRERML